jgi:methyl-accepting chemotaxis protein
MNFEQKTREIAKSLHKKNFNVMTPFTVPAILFSCIYVSIVFQGFRTSDGLLNGSLITKIIISFGIVGGTSTFIFEVWVKRAINYFAEMLAADSETKSYADKDIIDRILALVDFPSQFVKRFLIHWIINSILIVSSIRIFYALPFWSICYLAFGISSIMGLVSIFHYFILKRTYSVVLEDALKKYPDFFKRPEFKEARISYLTKTMVYIMVLVGSMVWITTHMSIVGQDYSMDVQRDRELDNKPDDLERLAWNVDSSKPSPEILIGFSGSVLGTDEYAYLFDKDGNDLLSYEIFDPDNPGILKPNRTVSEFDKNIMGHIPWKEEKSPGVFSMKFWSSQFGAVLKKGYFGEFFASGEPLIHRITDREIVLHTGRATITIPVQVLSVLAEGKRFTISILYLTENARLVEIRPQTGSTKIVTIIVLSMWLAALFLAGSFSWFMQQELMGTLSKIIRSSKDVADGDLTSSLPIMSDDELGVLAINHLRMVSSIKAIVEQISQTSSAVEDASRQIGDKMEEVACGSESQSTSVEETSASITEMNQTMMNVSESVDTLASGAEQSASSIIEMSATIDNVADSAEKLSSAAVETTSNIEEMSATLKQVSENVQTTSEKAGEAAGSMRNMNKILESINDAASESSSLSEQVTNNAESGADAVNSTIQGIEQIWESSRKATEVIGRLSKRAKEIGRILNVIEDVTEETNLLALNAAIIAAQAGDQGKGFAVVADEIKDLAERTQASTTEIVDLIESVQTDARDAVQAMEKGNEHVGKGVLLAEQAGESLNEIQKSALRSMEMVMGISASTREQNARANEVLAFFEETARMIEQIGISTMQQTKGSEQILASALQMRDIAERVKKATKEQSIGSRQISQSIEHTSEIANYISSATAEQKKASQQVMTAMDEIARVAASNVNEVEQVSQSVNNLQLFTDNLNAMLSTFKMKDED